MDVDLGAFPHCDQRILHGPSDNCEFCDRHPDWQALREAWGIAFTGYEPVVDAEHPWLSQVRCPSEAGRPIEVINRWPGNRPSPSTRPDQAETQSAARHGETGRRRPWPRRRHPRQT